MKAIKKTVGFVLLSMVALGLQAAASETGDKGVDTYVIDPVHSGVTFKVRHFFTVVPGSFGKFEGTILVDKEDMTRNQVTASIDTASISTHNADRDSHLRSPDFFDTDKFPAIEFVSTEWQKVDDSTYTVTGNLTLLGTTHPVTLTAHSLGFGAGMNGAWLSGWTVTGKIKRSEWGLSYGTPMIGDEVEIEINIQAVRQ